MFRIVILFAGLSCLLNSCRKKGNVSVVVMNVASGQPVAGLGINVLEVHLTGSIYVTRNTKILEQGNTDGNGEFSFNISFKKRKRFEYEVLIKQDYLKPPDTSDYELFYLPKMPHPQVYQLRKDESERVLMEVKPSGRMRFIATDNPPETAANISFQAFDDFEDIWQDYSSGETVYHHIATKGAVRVKIIMYDLINGESEVERVVQLPEFGKATCYFSY